MLSKEEALLLRGELLMKKKLTNLWGKYIKYFVIQNP